MFKTAAIFLKKKKEIIIIKNSCKHGDSHWKIFSNTQQHQFAFRLNDMANLEGFLWHICKKRGSYCSV